MMYTLFITLLMWNGTVTYVPLMTTGPDEAGCQEMAKYIGPRNYTSNQEVKSFTFDCRK